MFSKMSNSGQGFVVDYFGVSAGDFALFERLEQPLGLSIAYLRISNFYEVDVEKLLFNRATGDDCREVWGELDEVYSLIADEFWGTEVSKTLVDYVAIDQMTTQQTVKLYSISRALNIACEQLRQNDKLPEMDVGERGDR